MTSKIQRLAQFLIICFACVNAIELTAGQLPDDKDDRSEILEATAYHVMFRDEKSAEAARLTLLSTPKEATLAQFQQLARSASMDRGSANSGGYLGVIKEGQLDRTFEKNLFQQPINAVSSPIRSSFGWHLVYLSHKQTVSVKAVCQQTLQESRQSSKPTVNERLLISAEDRPPEQLKPEIQKVLGKDWSAPFTDWDQNVAFLKVLQSEAAKPRRRIQVHTEYIHPIYHANPLSCLRSKQEIWEIDCKSQNFSLRKSVEFEGRAGVGRALRSFSPPATQPPIKAGPSGYYNQLLSEACSKKG